MDPPQAVFHTFILLLIFFCINTHLAAISFFQGVARYLVQHHSNFSTAASTSSLSRCTLIRGPRITLVASTKPNLIRASNTVFKSSVRPSSANEFSMRQHMLLYEKDTAISSTCNEKKRAVKLHP